VSWAQCKSVLCVSIRKNRGLVLRDLRKTEVAELDVAVWVEEKILVETAGNEKEKIAERTTPKMILTSGLISL
jgi:hypothetical protein